MTISTRDTSYDLIVQAVGIEDTLRLTATRVRAWAAYTHDRHMTAIADTLDKAAAEVGFQRDLLIEERNEKVMKGEVEP